MATQHPGFILEGHLPKNRKEIPREERAVEVGPGDAVGRQVPEGVDKGSNES